MDAVTSRTQGWAAGLRMAAMSLAHRTDREDAARELAGNTGTVAEYLLAEVLDTQPAGPAPPAPRDQRGRRPAPGPGRRAGRPPCRASPQLPGARERLPRGAARAPGLLPLPPALPGAPARPAGVRGPGALGRAAPRRRHLAGRPRPGRGRGPARDGDRRLGDRRPLRRGRPLGAAAADGSRDRPAGRGPGADARRRPRARQAPSSRRRERLPRTTGAVSPRGSAGRAATSRPASRGRRPSWPSACWSSSLARRAGDADAALDAAATAQALVHRQSPARAGGAPGARRRDRVGLGAALVLAGRLNAAAEAFSVATEKGQVARPGATADRRPGTARAAVRASWRAAGRRPTSPGGPSGSARRPG